MSRFPMLCGGPVAPHTCSSSCSVSVSPGPVGQRPAPWAGYVASLVAVLHPCLGAPHPPPPASSLAARRSCTQTAVSSGSGVTHGWGVSKHIPTSGVWTPACLAAIQVPPAPQQKKVLCPPRICQGQCHLQWPYLYAVQAWGSPWAGLYGKRQGPREWPRGRTGPM